jgi:nucleoside-diphosphate-sugar epimerase
MRRVLLTGFSGFIGQHVTAPLRARGFEVHALGRTKPRDPDVIFHQANLLDGVQTADAVQRVAATDLLHLAWAVPPGTFWRAPSNLDWVAASLGLIRGFAEAGGRRVVVAGTCAEYSWTTARLKEGEAPYAPTSLYGASKDALRRILAAYASTVGLSTAWAHVFFQFGPGEPTGRLVSGAACALLAGKPFPTSHGRQRRDFLHVADVGEAFAAILDSQVQGAINIGSGRAVPIRELLNQLGRLTGRGDLIQFDARPAVDGEPDLIEADVRRLREEVQFYPRHTLESGLQDTVAYWRSRMTNPPESDTPSRNQPLAALAQ